MPGSKATFAIRVPAPSRAQKESFAGSSITGRRSSTTPAPVSLESADDEMKLPSEPEEQLRGEASKQKKPVLVLSDSSEAEMEVETGQREEEVWKIVKSIPHPDDAGDESDSSYLVQLTENGKKVKRTQKELLTLAPNLFAAYLASKPASSVSSTADQSERVAKPKQSIRDRSEAMLKLAEERRRREEEEEQELAASRPKSKEKGKAKETIALSDDEDADDEPPSGSSDESSDDEFSGASDPESPPRKRRREKPATHPTRQSTRDKRELLPRAELKKAMEIPIDTPEGSSESEDDDEHDRHHPSPKKTRRQAAMKAAAERESRTQTAAETSEDELRLKDMDRRAPKATASSAPASKSTFIVLSDDDDERDVNQLAPVASPSKGQGKIRAQNEHKKVCGRCDRPPTHVLLEKLRAKKTRGGRKRKRNKDEFADDTDAEKEAIERLGAWMECDVCINSSHFGCLPEYVRKPFVAKLKAEHDALHTPAPPSPSSAEAEPVKKPDIPRRDKIELNANRVFVLDRCSYCAKNGGKRCLECGKNGRLAVIAAEKPGDGDVEMSETAEGLPLMFRCYDCKRAAHYECLPRDNDDGSIPSEQHARSYLNANQCHECWSYSSPLDVILAWKQGDVADEADGEGTPEHGAEAKDEKTGKTFELPGAKDPTCSAKYLVKWQEEGYRQLSWIPHAYLVAKYPAKLSQFLLRGSLIKFDRSTEAEDVLEEDAELSKPDLGSAPPPDPNAQHRIPEAWSTVDRVLDVWYWSKDRRTKIPHERMGKKLPDDPKESLAMVATCYLKWRDLPYSGSTVEDPPTSEEDGYAEYVQAYERFLMASHPGMRIIKLNAKQLETVNKPRPESSFKSIKEQPDYVVGGKLMPFQLEGANFLLYSWWRRKGCILADEMGLGKTVQIITLLAVLNKGQGARPFLVAVPNSTIGNWVREFERWAPQLRVVPYGGDAASRKICEEYELFDSQGALKTHVVLATYEALEKNISVFRKVQRWDCLVVDEGQRLKGGPSGLLFRALQSLEINHRILLSGTPLNNNLRELFSLLHFIDAPAYPDIDAETAKYDDLTPEKVDQIRTLLKPYFLRRTKELVLNLPPLNEVVVPVSMTVLQRQLYRNLLENNIGAITAIYQKSGTAQKSKTKASFNNVLMQLRKNLGHPYLISPEIERQGLSAEQTFTNLTEASGKLVLLSKLLPKLKAQGHRVLIFSQFKLCLNIISDFLEGMNLKYLRLDGDTASLDRQRGIDAFQKEGSDIFCYILSTRAGGVGITLTSADTVILFDQDFNPQQDIQAISRAHRIGQKSPVRCFRLMTKGSCEERIFVQGNRKLGLDHLIIKRLSAEDEETEDMASILQYGAKAIFDTSLDLDQIKWTDGEIEQLLSKSVAVPLSPGKDNAASAFAVAKIWELEKGIVDVTAGEEEPEEDLKSFWASVLEQEEAKARAARQAAAKLPSKRKRGQVQYAVEDLESPQKTSKGTAEVSSGDEFAQSDDSDDVDPVSDTPMSNHEGELAGPQARKIAGLAKPMSEVGDSRDSTPVDQTERLNARRRNLEKLIAAAKAFDSPELQSLMQEAWTASFEQQTLLLKQATTVVSGILGEQRAKLAPKANGSNGVPKARPLQKPQQRPARANPFPPGGAGSVIAALASSSSLRGVAPPPGQAQSSAARGSASTSNGVPAKLAVKKQSVASQGSGQQTINFAKHNAHKE